MRRTVTWGGLYWDCKRGISRGCPLSPLLGAVFLSALDTAMEKLGLFYVRCMNDMLVFAPTRWKLKRAVKRLNEVFNSLKIEKHPDKTFIGRIENGFDFLGYHFSGERLKVAEITVKKHVLHIDQLYEQQRKKKATSNEMASTLGLYVKRWQRWTAAGLQGIKIDGVYGWKVPIWRVPSRPMWRS
jgi:RNA-directed DNA polymerase